MFEIIIKLSEEDYRIIFARRSETSLADLVIELRQYVNGFTVYDGDRKLYHQ